MDKLVSSSTPTMDINAIMRRSQARVWKTLEGEPEFIISVADTQNILGKAARSKMNFVILNVDLVASTKLSMTLPLDRLTTMTTAVLNAVITLSNLSGLIAILPPSLSSIILQCPNIAL
jgi:adenylate cyclase